MNSELTKTLRMGVFWGVEFEHALRLGHTRRDRQTLGSFLTTFLYLGGLSGHEWSHEKVQLFHGKVIHEDSLWAQFFIKNP